MKLPDVLVICKEPPTKDSLREMDTLIWLMLGAAVQCNQRVAIVEAIKTLPVEVQEEIALRIKEVLSLAMSSTDFPKNVLSIFNCPSNSY